MTIQARCGILFTVAALSLSACAGDQSGKQIQEAIDLYSQTIELEAEVRSIAGSLEQVIARDTTRAVFSSELIALSKALEEWERSVVSVGQASTDHLGHTHPVKNGLSGAEMLGLQTDIHGRLTEIADRFIALMDKMSH